MTSEEISRSIAVIGMSCRFPGADTPAQFWELPAAGKEAVRFFSIEEPRTRRAFTGPGLCRDIPHD